MFWIGFGIGFFIGGMVGFFGFALCMISKQSDMVGTINKFNQKEK